MWHNMPNRINCQLGSQFAFAEMGGARGTRDKEKSFSLFINSVVYLPVNADFVG